MFHNARIKLTAWYLFIIMLISIAFSMIIYRSLTLEVDRFAAFQKLRIERRLHDQFQFPGFAPANPPTIILIDPELVEETKRRIIVMLIIVNGIIFILSGGFGYVLAGRTLNPIQDMLEEQNRFISDSSHELRTPLTSLKTAMEVSLRDKKLTITEAKNIIKESIEEVNKLQLLSDELLQLAQYQKPNGNYIFTKINISNVLTKAIRKIEPLAKQKHIEIQTSIDPNTIDANFFGLEDLFVILLDNALKYSPKDSTIAVSSNRIDGYVAIHIHDQGIGINEKDIPHIFDRFFRADSVRTKNGVNGYGLGLSIAKKIVDAHNGSIHVKSIAHKGSKFTVQLPFKQTSGTGKPSIFS